MAAAAAAAPTPSSSEIANEGPVLNLINKRLRALRKKLNRISQMEESRAQGKTLNKEQEETLRSKPYVVAGIDELEKIRQPLLSAVDQEIELVLAKNSQKADSEITNDGDAEPEGKAPSGGGDASAVPDLLNLLYFGSVFDVQTLMRANDNMLTRTHERNCCLTYDYVTDDDAAGDPLKEWDLDVIATVGGLLISRPVNSSLSHKDSLEKCVEHAKLWLANADHPIEPGSNITYAGLRQKLNKIMASDYFTTTPEIKAPVEVAAAAGNYTFQVPPVHGSVTAPVSMPAPVEGSSTEFQQEDEQSPNSHDNEIYGDEAGPVEELHQGGLEVENQSEDQAQTEHGIPDGDAYQDLTDADMKEQHHAPRKPYQNYRGGRGDRGRRGYSNGRGGRGGSRGGYQNGRSQFYDQPGGYQPRNNYNYRGRGGRGMGGNFNYQGPSGNAQTAS
ncbi:uncharacterized protein LOC131025245 [Salvia miltiorrhiza]|uniref:uncharacterized protein LOC131025245 n=1 Tax=Salvia miltiorrhiza TaxID=226208 RepID=UPI0025AB5DC5|nr:uncharacterized protein LOC131025245 [Salvia miltiorrhiza]